MSEKDTVIFDGRLADLDYAVSLYCIIDRRTGDLQYVYQDDPRLNPEPTEEEIAALDRVDTEDTGDDE